MVVKDVRSVDYGVEADIEISKGRLRGVAKLKIWGPSKSPNGKNKCTIQATRFPKSHKKYATILSKKILKPLIDSHLKGEGWNTIMSSKPIIRNERVHCPECDKSVRKLYFNTHDTKMHTQCNICQEKFTSVKEMTKHKGQNIVKQQLRLAMRK